MAAPESLSVADLLARARADSPRDLDQLFALCRNYLKVVARAQVESWLRAKVDASDVVQQTLLEAYRDFRNFRGSTEAEWLAWLRRILAHNAANFVRHYRGTDKRQAGREVALGAPADGSAAGGALDPADSVETPSQQLLRKERELQVADALARLAPDHREVIVLRNLQRLPFEEVARRMDRSRPATQMLWMRAVQKLQEMLAAELSAGP
jgi:RNA polymerase sigma-70 factor (ECF subfamily)